MGNSEGRDMDKLIDSLTIDELKCELKSRIFDITQLQQQLTASKSRELALEERVKLLEQGVSDFVEWNEKYPSSRIYSEGSIRKIASELDEICTKSKILLTTKGE